MLSSFLEHCIWYRGEVCVKVLMESIKYYILDVKQFVTNSKHINSFQLIRDEIVRISKAAIQRNIREHTESVCQGV